MPNGEFIPLEDEDAQLWLGRRLLRRYHEGSLELEDRRTQVLVIIEPSSGAIIMPVDPEMSQSDGLVLHMPDESASVIQVMLTATRIQRPEAEEAVDRWMLAHGKPPGGQAFTRCVIDGAKTRGHPPELVFSGESLMQPNVLGRGEFALVKRLNADAGALARACACHGAIEVVSPLAIGVDVDGVDVRARFGVLRLEFQAAAPARDLAHASAWVDWLLKADRSAPLPQ